LRRGTQKLRIFARKLQNSNGFAHMHNAFASMVHELSVAIKTAIG